MEVTQARSTGSLKHIQQLVSTTRVTVALLQLQSIVMHRGAITPQAQGFRK